MDALFAVEPLAHFKHVSQEVLNNLYDSNKKTSTIIEDNIVENAKLELQQLIMDSSFNIDEAAAFIEEKSYDQDKVNYFSTVLKERRIDLLYTLLAHDNSPHGESLTNFNWILKLVLGTSELRSLRYPILQLVLNTKIVYGKEKQTLYELNKEELAKIIKVLEEVQ